MSTLNENGVSIDIIDIPLMDKTFEAGQLEMKMRIYFPKNAFISDDDDRNGSKQSTA